MTKTTLKLLFCILILSNTSCNKINDSLLEADYKVVEIDYGFLNYMKNNRDQSKIFSIKQRNLVIINIDKTGKITVKDNDVEVDFLSSELQKYITPDPENKQMPATIEKEFDFLGKVVVTQNLLIMCRFDKELKYEKYNEIRNKIFVAFNEARNELSIKKFNKTLKELVNSTEKNDHQKWEMLKDIIPIHYTEDIIDGSNSE